MQLLQGLSSLNNSPGASSTLAILLCATGFPEFPEFQRRSSQNQAFGASFEAFCRYLLAIGIPAENILVSKDDDRLPQENLVAISRFIDQRCADASNRGIQIMDLLVYFVGHGDGDGPEYRLYVRRSNEQFERSTTIIVVELFRVLKHALRHAFKSGGHEIRLFVLLDACYSTRAYDAAMQLVTGVKKRRLRQFPSSGMSMLCSANAKEQAISPIDEPLTAFTACLLEVLTCSREQCRQLLTTESERLSLAEVGRLVGQWMQTKYRGSRHDLPVPQVLSPDTITGDLQHVPLFPNPLSAAVTLPVVALTGWRRSTARRMLWRMRSRLQTPAGIAVVIVFAFAAIAVLIIIKPPIPTDYDPPPSLDPSNYIPTNEILVRPPDVSPKDVDFRIRNLTRFELQLRMVNCTIFRRAQNPDYKPLEETNIGAESTLQLKPKETVSRPFLSESGWYVFFVRRIDDGWYPYREFSRDVGARNVCGAKYVLLTITESSEQGAPYVWTFEESNDAIPGSTNLADDEA